MTTKLKFEDGRERDVWLDPLCVETVTAIPTRYGPRLLVQTVGGNQVWLLDTPEARDLLIDGVTT